MIAVEVTYDAADYARAFMFMQKQKFARRYWYILLAVWTAGVIGLLYFTGFDLQQMGYFLILVFLLVVTTVLTMPLFLRWNFRRQLKSFPAAQGVQTFTFNGEGLQITGSLGNSEIKWEAITKALESSNEFLFYISNNFSYFLPKRAFSSSEHQITWREVLKDKLGDKAKLA